MPFLNEEERLNATLQSSILASKFISRSTPDVANRAMGDKDEKPPSEVITSSSRPLQTNDREIAKTFPEKLHLMLQDAELKGQQEIVSWQPHGQAFRVHKPDKFVEEFLPKYFNQSKYTSFQRQLNLYCFRRLKSGIDKGAYYHELFLRDKPSTCQSIRRMRIKGSKRMTTKTDFESEPVFSEMVPSSISQTHRDQVIKISEDGNIPLQQTMQHQCHASPNVGLEYISDLQQKMEAPFQYFPSLGENIVLDALHMKHQEQKKSGMCEFLHAPYSYSDPHWQTALSSSWNGQCLAPNFMSSLCSPTYFADKDFNSGIKSYSCYADTQLPHDRSHFFQNNGESLFAGTGSGNKVFDSFQGNANLPSEDSHQPNKKGFFHFKNILPRNIYHLGETPGDNCKNYAFILPQSEEKKVTSEMKLPSENKDNGKRRMDDETHSLSSKERDQMTFRDNDIVSLCSYDWISENNDEAAGNELSDYEKIFCASDNHDTTLLHDANLLHF